MGCLAVALFGLFGLLFIVGLPLALVIDAAPDALVALLAAVGLLAVYTQRTARARRAERAARRRRQQLLERGQRPALWGVPRAPVNRATRLPRTWWQPVEDARRAAHSYLATVSGMPPGPLRERLEQASRTMEVGVERCDALARRGAELERQLRGLPQQAAPPAGLREGLDVAHARLRDQSAAMALVAAHAAQVAVSQSLGASDDTHAALIDLETTVGGLARAMDDVRELDTGASGRRTSGRSGRPAGGAPSRVAPPPPAPRGSGHGGRPRPLA
jgi:hypothetical protein